MREPNLIEIVKYEGTMWERKYLVSEGERILLDSMICVAKEIKAYGQFKYADIPEKKGSMTGLANRILRTADKMMDDFDTAHTERMLKGGDSNE